MPKSNTNNVFTVRFFFTFCVIVLLCTNLVQSRLFILPLLTTYYLYVAVGVVIVLLSVISLQKKGTPEFFSIPIPVLLFSCWGVYILAHGWFTSSGFNTQHVFLITSCCLFIALFIASYLGLIAVKAVYITIGSIALFEAIICILQLVGLISSKNVYFDVTGSWENPNVTAMFLALSVPAIFPFLVNADAKIKKFIVSVLLIIGIALLSLKCRTAYLGVAIAVGCLLYFRFNWAIKIKEKRHRSAIIVIAAIATFLSLFLGNLLYQAKRNSADGRKLVWKLSAAMFIDKPIVGYGYGQFERNYNIYQSNYIKAGKASDDELENAGFVKTGYNEYLESAVSGGIIGFCLFLGLNASLLYFSNSIKKIIQKNPYVQSAYTGVAIFAGMSIINFSASAIVIMLSFTIYASLFCAMVASDAQAPAFIKISSKYFRPSMSIILILAAFNLILSQYHLPFESYNDSIATSLGKKKKYNEAIDVFRLIKGNIPDNNEYLINYGTALLLTNNLADALTIFNKAKLSSSDPDLFKLSGECYFKLKRYTECEREFTTAAALQPRLFAPRVALMNLYYVTHDTARAVYMAYGILKMQPKIQSAQSNNYKLYAKNLLTKLNRSLEISQPNLNFKRISNQAAFNQR